MSSRKIRKALLFSPRGTTIGKAVLRDVAKGGETIPGVGLAVTALRSTSDQIELEKRRQKALARLFGTSDPLYLVGGDAHPQFPLLHGELVYPSDRNAAQRLKDDFFRGMDFKEVKECIPEETMGSLIAIGSSVSTPITRWYMGDPQEPKMVINLPEYRYEVRLHYNHLAPDARAPSVKNFQEGRKEPWCESNWGIITANGDELFPRIEKEWLVMDYLLVTRIPSPIRGAGDIIMFGGLMAPERRLSNCCSAA